MARPKIEIDPEQVFKLAQLGCNNTEIGTIVGCSDDVIATRFKEQIEKGRASLKMTLRRWQLDAAKKGNVSMLIWLGKNILNQIDKRPEEVEDTIIVTADQKLSKEEIKDLLLEARREARKQAIIEARKYVKDQSTKT